jgi:hypothetical protein
LYGVSALDTGHLESQVLVFVDTLRKRK